MYVYIVYVYTKPHTLMKGETLAEDTLQLEKISNFIF